MAQSGKRVRFDNNQVDESTTSKGPVEEANRSRSLSILSLATSFLEVPSFMEELSKQNVLLHDQINKKSVTIKHLQADDTVPRSLRSKFELQVPTLSNDTLHGLQLQCNEALKTSQDAIKKIIIEARTKELQELQLKKGKVCVTFLCNTAKAYLVINEHYNDINVVAICNQVMANPAVFPIYNSINADTRKLELQKWFPDVNHDLTADFRNDPFAVAFSDFLIKVIDTCLCVPLQKYEDAQKRFEKITALRKLNASILVTQKTEDTVMQLDQEQTISPKLLDQLIADKFKKETHKLQQLLKKQDRGASSASLKKKPGTQQTKWNQSSNSSQHKQGKGQDVSKPPLRHPKATQKSGGTADTRNKGSKPGTKQTPSSKDGLSKNNKNKSTGRRNNSGKQQE